MLTLKKIQTKSLYLEELTINSDRWLFESGSCGQCDTRNTMQLFTNKQAYDLIHELWDKYHLKKVEQDVVDTVNKLNEVLSEIDEEEWIENYIRTYLINYNKN